MVCFIILHSVFYSVLNYRLNDRTYLRTYTEHITADRGKGGTDDLYHR